MASHLPHGKHPAFPSPDPLTQGLCPFQFSHISIVPEIIYVIFCLRLQSKTTAESIPGQRSFNHFILQPVAVIQNHLMPVFFHLIIIDLRPELSQKSVRRPKAFPLFMLRINSGKSVHRLFTQIFKAVCQQKPSGYRIGHGDKGVQLVCALCAHQILAVHIIIGHHPVFIPSKAYFTDHLGRHVRRIILRSLGIHPAKRDIQAGLNPALIDIAVLPHPFFGQSERIYIIQSRGSIVILKAAFLIPRRAGIIEHQSSDTALSKIPVYLPHVFLKSGIGEIIPYRRLIGSVQELALPAVSFIK